MKLTKDEQRIEAVKAEIAAERTGEVCGFTGNTIPTATAVHHVACASNWMQPCDCGTPTETEPEGGFEASMPKSMQIPILPKPTATAGGWTELAQEWAADDRKWNTQDVVAVNLIAFANAALAAKDEHIKLATKGWQGIYDKLRKERCAKYEDLVHNQKRTIQQLRKQLAAAELSWTPETKTLAAYVAEKCQPLVSVLLEIRDWFAEGHPRRIQIDDLLAQYKNKEKGNL